jgi:voltage-gated potassium channel
VQQKDQGGFAPGRRLVLGTVARSIAVAAGLVAVYFVAPLDQESVVMSFVVLAGSCVALTVLVGVQVQAVVSSPRPALRAIEALAVSVPSLVLIFACGYYVMSRQDPANFNEALSRLDALYFSMTTLATVGYGDIVARSEVGRAVVSLQMLFDLVALGIGVRVIVGAVQIGRQRSAGTTAGPSTGA